MSDLGSAETEEQIVIRPEREPVPSLLPIKEPAPVADMELLRRYTTDVLGMP